MGAINQNFFKLSTSSSSSLPKTAIYDNPTDERCHMFAQRLIALLLHHHFSSFRFVFFEFNFLHNKRLFLIPKKNEGSRGRHLHIVSFAPAIYTISKPRAYSSRHSKSFCQIRSRLCRICPAGWLSMYASNDMYGCADWSERMSLVNWGSESRQNASCST
jgi:hypothetical protein